MGIAKTVTILVIVFLFAIFVLQNSAVVDIQFLFWRIAMSKVLILLISLAIGCLLGILIGWEIFGRKGKPEEIE